MCFVIKCCHATIKQGYNKPTISFYNHSFWHASCIILNLPSNILYSLDKHKQEITEFFLFFFNFAWKIRHSKAYWKQVLIITNETIWVHYTKMDHRNHSPKKDTASNDKTTSIPCYSIKIFKTSDKSSKTKTRNAPNK